MGLPGVFVLMVLESACIPVPSEATMLFAGFNVSSGEYSLFAATAVGRSANLVGSWIAYWIGYAGRVDILEKHGRKLHIKKSPPRVGRPLVRAPRRRHRLLHPDAPDHPHVHLAAGGRGAHAVLALHRVHAPRLHPVGADADLHRQAGGRQLGELEGQPPLRGLRGGRRIVVGVVWLVVRNRRRAQPERA